MPSSACGNLPNVGDLLGRGLWWSLVDRFREDLVTGPGVCEDPLFRRFLERDPEALATVEAAVTRVVRFRGYEVPAADRRDLVQESLLQIWREVGRAGFAFRENFLAFTCLVAYRRCLDWRRARRPVDPIDAAIPDESRRPDASLLSQEQVNLARRVLSELAEPCRELVRLHIHEERPYSEIALMQGRSEGAVRTHMWSCLKAAREILERALRRPPGPATRRSS